MIGRGVRHMAKRGRPSKGDFAWMDQIPDEELPEHIRKRIKEGLGSPENQKLIDGIRAQIADYHKGLSEWNQIPEEIFLAYASLNQGFDFYTPEDEATIKAAYEVAYAKAKGNAYQSRGTEAGKHKADARAQAVWGMDGKNKDLLRRIEKGSLSLNGAITIILSDLETRGDDELKPPSARTLSNWYYMLYPNK